MPTLPPIHPGEVLREEFLAPLQLSAGAVARRVGVPRTRIERLVAEEVDLSPDTALRLARLFGTTAEFWLAIQARHSLESAAERLGDALDAIAPVDGVEHKGAQRPATAPRARRRKVARARPARAA